ncbi:putative aminoadipate reductase [Crepidotus variabilis]|uniref:Aminoadipate reductase n=1 Tax=Crepidotus variabilis TaxID=179855 RepID=A0A9P6EDW2_9AGAR|nr:putative aminoadipate reductase [Crepidotus variabilis]
MTIQTAHGVAAPTDGSVNLPETIDFNRKHNPDSACYIYAPENPQLELTTTISHLEFGRAADRFAHILRPARHASNREVIAVVALSDAVLYQAVFIGIMRAGFIPFPMSPRNTAAAIIKLMKESSAHRLLTTRETLKSLVNDIEQQISVTDPEYKISVEEMPSLNILYPKLGCETIEDAFTPYPAGPRLSLNDTLLYLHSSGSTGLPKSIRHSFLAMIHWASFPVVTEIRDHPNPQVKASHAAPCFHTIGVVSQILVPLYGLVPIGVYPPTAKTSTTQPIIPSPQNIIDHTRRTKSTSLIILPALLQLWAQDPEIVEFLASLDFIIFAGGSLPSRIGDRFAKAGAYLSPVYGATEFGVPVHYFRGSGGDKEWEYFRFCDLINIRWAPQGDGTFEAHFLSGPTHRVSVENLPDVPGYSSSDIFVQHPTKPQFWKVVGRADDVIVHISGEKTVPAPMEDIMMSSPYLMGVVMFGRERDQAGVLVELKPEYAIDVTDEQQVIKARNLVWPIIEEANKVCPAFSRIFKELILFVSKEKPLPRAGKGSVMRKAALVVYKDEIDEIYARVQATVKGDAVLPPASWSYDDVQAWLVDQVADIHSTRTNGKIISVSDDIFEQGLDSLSATILRRRIVGGLQAQDASASSSTAAQKLHNAALQISHLTVYENPSIEKMTQFLFKLVAGNGENPSTNRVDAIEKMIEKYSQGLPSTLPALNGNRNTKDELSSPGMVVLITGTTGNLGSQLLESLLNNSAVQRVYTLNRSSDTQDIKQRHTERFKDKELAFSLLDDSRVVFLEGDTSKDKLGQKDQVYAELLKYVTIIIHNAWRLDFNLSLASFEPNIRGTRNVIDFARSSNHASSVKVLFTSSIACAMSWDQSKGKYPEEVVPDAKYAIGNGYGESKYVSEQILSRSGLDTTSFRIGQITGPRDSGAWATTDWVPILVKSSITLGALPSCCGVVSWLPMDAVAQAILDVAFAPHIYGSKYPALNIVHPRPVSWDAVIEGINDALVNERVLDKKLPIMEFQKWFSRLEGKSGMNDTQVQDLPATKLLNFFRPTAEADSLLRQQPQTTSEAGALTDFSTQKVQTISRAIQILPSLQSKDATAWVKYWKRNALFNTNKRL